jgi:hypothetical protein
MTDVSAVVLSLGEPFVERAITSLKQQTVPVSDVVVVENVSPFFRAINEGARQVKTEFFIQVDADMILDPNCVEVLLDAMTPDTGLTFAVLRDPLTGIVYCVKLFRTKVFQTTSMPDSVSQDTDFVKNMKRRGWKETHVTHLGADTTGPFITLGEHRPDYSPAYTYRKFLIEGARLRYRGARGGFFSKLASLEDSKLPVAPLAEVAITHGFFVPMAGDELKPPEDEPGADELMSLLTGSGRLTGVDVALTGYARLRDVFRRYVSIGEQIAAAKAGESAREALAATAGATRDWRRFVAKVGLGHGLLRTDEDRMRSDANEEAFRRLMVLEIGSQGGFAQYAGGYVRYYIRRLLRRRNRVPW